MSSFTWLTPPAASAIAVLRCACVDGIVRRWPAVGNVALVVVRMPDGAVVDEALALRLNDTEAELHVHGGAGMRASVTAALCAHGLIEAPPIADAWADLAVAPSAAAVAWRLQHPPPAMPPFAPDFLSRQPVVLITGPANAGKSTLLNACCGHARALVSDRPGTTRDLVSTEVTHRDWRLRLVDSAGLRATTDTLEAAGQDLVVQARARADLVLYLHPADAVAGPAAQPGDLVVWGKADLGLPAGVPAGMLAWSAQDGDASARRSQLLDAVLARLGLAQPPVVRPASGL